MHENFERACDEATRRLRGRGDRQDGAAPVGARSRRPRARRTTRSRHRHLVERGYDPLDESQRPRPRALSAYRDARGAVALYDPRAELARRFVNEERARRRPHPLRPRQDRLRRVLARAARADPRADRSRLPSACARLHLDGAGVRAGARRARRRPATARLLQLGRSNGRLQSIDPAHARRFIEGVDPAIIDALPIPGLYASHHNVVALRPRLVRRALPARRRAAARTRQPRAAEPRGSGRWSPGPDRASATRSTRSSRQRRRGWASPRAATHPAKAASRRVARRRVARIPLGTRAAACALGRDARAAGRRTRRPCEAARAADRHYAAAVGDRLPSRS